PINLDDVIYYYPPTKKLYFKPFRVPSSYDLETFLAPNELTEEVTIDSSNVFDTDFLNASSGRDINVAILNIYTGGGLKKSIPLYSISVSNSLCIPVVEEEILSRIEVYKNEKQSTLTDLLPRDAGIEVDELGSKPVARVIGKSILAEKYNR
ncbi:hypothetical protein N7445_006147, partial [Penicillium cf. griseofulvum]